MRTQQPNRVKPRRRTQLNRINWALRRWYRTAAFRLLPLAASLMMGAFAKQARHSPAGRASAGPAGGGLIDMLTPLLDQNRNGSIVDDVTSMIGRFMKPS